MERFLSSVVLLLLDLVLWVLNLLTGNLVADWAARLLIVLPIPRPIAYFIAFGILNAALYLMSQRVLRLWLFAVELEKPAWLVSLEEMLNCSKTGWPAWILGPLGIALILNLPDALGDASHAITWWLIFYVLWGLGGNYLKSTQRPDSQTQLRNTKRDVNRPIPTTRQFVENLRRLPFYAGQIRYDSSANPTQSIPFLQKRDPIFSKGASRDILAADTILNETLTPLGIKGAERVYAHQGQVVELAEKERSSNNASYIVFSTSQGSGRSTTSILLAVKRILSEHRTVLLVYPTRLLGELHQKKLIEGLKEADWDWAIDSLSIWEDSDAPPPNPTPDIVFTTIDQLHRSLLGQRASWEGLWIQLGLVIVDDLERYTGTLGSNAAFVFRRLTRVCARYGIRVQFLAISQPLKNIVDYAQRVLGHRLSADELVIENGAPAHTKHFVVWNPPLKTTQPQVGRAPTFAQRADYMKEAQDLMAQAIKDGLEPVLLSKTVGLTESDFLSVRQPILEALGEPHDIYVDSSLVALGKEPREFDLAIITGISGPPGFLNQELQHLGLVEHEDALICVIPPQEPLSQFTMRRPEEYLSWAGTDPREGNPIGIITLENPLIRKNHMWCAANDFPLSAEEVDQYFPPGSLTDLKELLTEGKIQSRPTSSPKSPKDAAEYVAIVPSSGSPLLEMHMDTTGFKPVKVVEDDLNRVADVIDLPQAVQTGFLGSVFVLDGERYEVQKGFVGQDEFRISKKPRAPRVERISNVVVRPTAPPSIMEDQRFGAEGLVFRLGLGRVKVTESVRGRHEDEIQGWNEFGKPGIATFREPLSVEFETEAGWIAFPEASRALATDKVLHTLVHLLRSSIPLLVQNDPREIGICYDQEFELVQGGTAPTVFIYDNIPAGIGVARVALIDNRKFVLTTAYNMLDSCPCENGCPGCIHITDCRSDNRNQGLDKAGTLELLGQLLQIPEYQSSVQQRQSQTLDDIKVLLDIRQRLTMDIFPNQLGIPISAPVDARFMNEDEQKTLKVDGLFMGSLVLVRANPYRRIVAIVAHEYAHNWQHESGNMHPSLRAERVPFHGKLFVEGFAEWIEYKALDAYGLSNQVNFSDLTNYDEYKAGFDIMRYLEKRGGLSSVLEFLRAGEAGYPGGLEKLYEDSGVRPTVVAMEVKMKGKKTGFSTDWVEASNQMIAFPKDPGGHDGASS